MELAALTNDDICAPIGGAKLELSEGVLLHDSLFQNTSSMPSITNHPSKAGTWRQVKPLPVAGCVRSRRVRAGNRKWSSGIVTDMLDCPLDGLSLEGLETPIDEVLLCETSATQLKRCLDSDEDSMGEEDLPVLLSDLALPSPATPVASQPRGFRLKAEPCKARSKQKKTKDSGKQTPNTQSLERSASSASQEADRCAGAPTAPPLIRRNGGRGHWGPRPCAMRVAFASSQAGCVRSTVQPVVQSFSRISTPIAIAKSWRCGGSGRQWSRGRRKAQQQQQQACLSEP